MTKKVKNHPLNEPQAPAISAGTVAQGPSIPPIERIKLFSNSQWEDFTLEWAHSLKTKYAHVERCGGAGDMGRDVVATTANSEQHYFQCKHYDKPLTPTTAWLELGKLVYYSHQEAYDYPDKYFFVAPQGIGTKLSNLLRSPVDLKAELKKLWDDKCRDKITSKNAVPLTTALDSYLDGLDFGIFATVQPLQLIEDHKSTSWYTARFGGGLPVRPDPKTPPQTPSEEEINYVRELLNAYGDHLGRALKKPSDLSTTTQNESLLLEHFNDARTEFYSAESLRVFSRDTLPQGEFGKLQGEVHHGIKDELRAAHADGYARVLGVVKTARQLQLSAHPLQSAVTVRDRGGICHQLANERKIKWVN